MSMPIPSFSVSLNYTPEDRWRGIEIYRDAARALVAYYVRDLGGLGQFGDLLAAYRDACVTQDYAREMKSLAKLLGMPESEILLTNLYYDAIKHIIACTAFAVDGVDGPLHARNLDWWTEGEMLSEHTLLTEYSRLGQPHFTVVGWPGYAGALSGVAHGRFAVTLNSVLSDDPPELAAPVTFVLRDVLDTARNFDEAVARLQDTPLASDSLLLVTGTNQGEMVVVERTPNREAVREAEDGIIVATNDYHALSTECHAAAVATLADTSCSRFKRASHLLRQYRPTTVDGCYSILLDDQVRMNMTVQSMVLSARRSLVDVRLP